MDNSVLKERAKNNIAKKRGEAIVVALIIAFAAGSAAVPGFNFSVNLDSNALNSNSYYSSDFPFEIFSAAVILMLGVASAVVLAKTVFLSPLTVGGHRFFLKIRKDVNTGIGEVIGNFKDGNYLNVVLIMFLQLLFTALWSLLCVIPGIVKAYEYSMIPYILAVRPDIDRKEAFRLSKTLTNGHKGDLFILDFSFIGWDILSALTCGILSIVYVAPYKYAATAEAYAFLREDAIRRGTIRSDELPAYGGDSFDYAGQPFGGFPNGFDAQNAGFNPPPYNNPNSGFTPTGNGFGGTYNQPSGFAPGGFNAAPASDTSSNSAPADTASTDGSPVESSPADTAPAQDGEPQGDIPTAEAEFVPDTTEKTPYDATESAAPSSPEQPEASNEE